MAVSEEQIVDKIYLIRGKKVMLDRDLAELYGVETRVLNQAVKRNSSRFPADFMFQLTSSEMQNWMSQIVISNSQKMGLRKPPLVFTEMGVSMLSSVLNSETAIEVNIQIVRIFHRMHELITTHKDILFKIEQMEKELLKQTSRLSKNEEDIQAVFKVIKQLLIKPKAEPRTRVGFRRKDERD